MRFGCIIPNNWGVEDAQEVIGIAKLAEQMGFDSVWVNHHVFNAGYIRDRLGNRPYYDALTTLAYLAAVTERVRLGTTVMVIPYLNPMNACKAITTIDNLSGGRMVFGIGVGAIKEESDALGSDFESRGRYANESLAIMKELWASESTSFEGEFFRFENMVFSPKSTQKPHPPIWVGGTSRPAMRRAAKYGDGWHPTRVSPQGFTEALPYLQRHLDANGRGLTDMTLSSRVELEVTSSLNPSIDGTMVGTPDQLLAIIEGYDKVGVREIVLAMSTGSIDEIERRMTDFVEKVKPLV